jgi:dTDP-4-amino-4,6-dideoxygalactose transaminase
MLSNLPLVLPKIDGKKISSFHLYVIKIDKTQTNIKRDFIFNHLRSKNIMVNIHYIPIYRHSFYKKFNFKKKNFPQCEEYYNSAISIPLFTSLNIKNQNKIIKEIKSIFLS